MVDATEDLEKSPISKIKSDPGLRQRLIVIDILIPTLLIFTIVGSWPLAIFVALLLGLATWEFRNLFKAGGYSPSLPLMIFFVVAAVILRNFYQFRFADLWVVLLLFTAMFWHILAQQKGIKTAAVDYVITVGGALYVGYLGSYIISIRTLDNGLYWLLTSLPVIFIADTGAYVLGRVFGRHKMFPAVSPKKSWEGYIGGILTGVLSGWGLAALWHIHIQSILPIHGLILGAVISVLAPFGDFGESMIKRQFNVKDSGKALLEHGGFLDRMDSSLWTVAIGYYLILLFIG